MKKKFTKKEAGKFIKSVSKHRKSKDSFTMLGGQGSPVTTTPMVWTKRLPTEPGWYWAKTKYDGEEGIVLTNEIPNIKRYAKLCGIIAWSNIPIPMPKETK
jgi:hypothetical protein